MANILIIDDDRLICDAISNAVKRMGHTILSTFTRQEGLKAAQSGSFDLVFLDVKLPDGNGLDILPEIRKTSSAPEVLIITGFGSPDGAELAIKNGAWDYIEKPCSLQAMTLPLMRALQYREEKQNKAKQPHLKREGIVGTSRKTEALLDQVAQAAASDVSVLITGEAGTGKELFARAIHNNSKRADKGFVVVDCSSLSEMTAEGILLGEEKGSETRRPKAGLFPKAEGGTIFLDEVTELPLSFQKTFLQLIQDWQFRPIGGKKEVTGNFRLISASNRDLDSMVKRREFRDDLLFRLRVFTMKIPPLRERREDIKDLIRYYVPEICKNFGISEKRISVEFMDVLMHYNWPRNIQELIHTLEQAISGDPEDPVLFPKHLPDPIRVSVARASVGEGEGETAQAKADPTKPFQKYGDYLAEAEHHYLKDLLSLTQGNTTKACEISGLSRPRLAALLKKYRLS